MLAAQGFLYDASADCMGIDLLIMTFLPEIEKCFRQLFTIYYNPCRIRGHFLFYSFSPCMNDGSTLTAERQ